MSSREGSPIRFICDDGRHLVCLPYSVPNLHEMARALGIARCWYHRRASYPHYDIPKRRVAEIAAKCTVVSGRVILGIVKGQIRDLTGVEPSRSANGDQP